MLRNPELNFNFMPPFSPKLEALPRRKFACKNVRSRLILVPPPTPLSP